ncbi:IclR family transcriptional regulator [soil metagenome]
MVPRYPLASVDNALRIVLHLRVDPELRVAEVARMLGVASSTAHRLLAALCHRGLLEQDHLSRTYRPGPVLAELAAVARPPEAVTEVVRPAVESASHWLGETVHLGVRRGRLVHYLDAVESARAMRVVARTGRTLPAHCTAIGKALLAELDDDELDELYTGHTLDAETSRSITALRALRDDLEGVRTAGYSVNDGESEDDVFSVAVTVRDLLGVPVAAIGVAAPASRLGVNDAFRVADVLRRCLEGVTGP